ncbi:MAG: hypothetical protein OXN27_17200, partial [Candidatus Poribacteria bacterium]|nr:hypothetical protein [Candidatus Poribacteria bacterium]
LGLCSGNSPHSSMFVVSHYELIITEVNDAINQWAQTEISAVNERLVEIENLKRYYDYGRVL